MTTNTIMVEYSESSQRYVLIVNYEMAQEEMDEMRLRLQSPKVYEFIDQVEGARLYDTLHSVYRLQERMN